MNHEFSQDSLRTFLLTVSDAIVKEDLQRLKYVCKDYVSKTKHDELAEIISPFKLFELLVDDHLIDANDVSFLVGLLKVVKLDFQSKRVFEYNESIKDGNHNTVRRPHKYGLKNKKRSFMGRDTMLSDIFNYFTCENKRMVVVLGPPGLGKSEVVIHVGHQLYEEGLFSVIFVCMQQRTTMDNLCTKILKTVDPDFKLSDSVVEQAQNFLVSLQTPTLLILDNCEDIQNSTSQRDFQKFIEYIGRDGNMVKLLLGTRNPVTAHTFDSLVTKKIKPLEVKPSVELLKIYAPNIDDASAHQLAEACKGVPLLIKLVSGQLKNGYIPTKLAEDLEANPYDVLKIVKYLCDSIRLFLNSLDMNLRCALVSLSNFSSLFTEKEVNMLYISNSIECRSMLAHLCEMALIQCEDGLYSIHPLIQTFCREEQEQISCAQEGQKAKRDFTVHYLNKLETIHTQFESKEFPEALETYEGNKMNIEQARQNAIKSEDNEIKVRCLDAFNNSVNILVKVTSPKQCHTVYKELLKEAEHLKDTKQIAKCNVSIGFRHLLDCNHLKFSQEAFDSLLCAHEHFKRLPKKERESEAFAHCLSKLGLCYWLNYNKKKGKKLMGQAARIRCNLGKQVLIAAGHVEKAIALMAVCNYDGNVEKPLRILHKQCYPIYESELGKHPWMATLLTYMSKCNQRLKKLDEAIENINQSLDIRNAMLGDHQDTARSYVFLAEILKEKGKREEALDNYNKALSVQKKVLKIHEETISSLEAKAEILYSLKRTQEGDTAMEEANQYRASLNRRQIFLREISEVTKQRSNSHHEYKHYVSTV